MRENLKMREEDIKESVDHEKLESCYKFP